MLSCIAFSAFRGPCSLAEYLRGAVPIKLCGIFPGSLSHRAIHVRTADGQSVVCCGNSSPISSPKYTAVIPVSWIVWGRTDRRRRGGRQHLASALMCVIIYVEPCVLCGTA
ncbi:hypothetical protein B0H11DRAFT_2135057 [Mycena galericulata]|nr:hypothetical protein B0H11DRAFT_2135057 [Mycena galericulata]